VHDELPATPPAPVAPPAPAAPAIPAQRAPQWPEIVAPVYPPPPPPFDPALLTALAAERSKSKRALFVAGAVFLVLALMGTVGVVVIAAHRSVAPAAAVAPTAEATPVTPFDTASAALDAQATALLKGDEKGWLAAVDPAQPKLQQRYHTMYSSLRALGVSQFEYHAFIRDSKEKSATTVAVGVDISYCFSMDSCPEYSSSGWTGPPQIAQSVTLKPVGGHYVITSVGKAAEPNHLQPTPWESGDLVFAQGKRVTVAAPRNEAGHLAAVVAAADKAALVNDRFAGYVGNPQKRYRVYLADDKTWLSWYGGQSENKWVVGYAIPLNEAESDVVLRASQLLGDRKVLETTVQHELGHVVTIGGVHGGGNDRDLWLIEGIAEYIGWSPYPATSSWRRDSVRAAVHGKHPPTTIAAKPLADNASDQAGDAFYGLGHFAADCMAQKFGQRKLFDFVKLTLRDGYGYEQASQEAYGKPFSTVDKACVSWIRAQA
jgi:hypothetical protein